MRRSLLVGLALAAILLAVLQRGLESETFFAGDSGVKLVATRSAIARPMAPLEIPLPFVGGEPAPFVDPFYRVHGSHRHAVTPELFPIITAPFLAALGPRGVYVLPALGWLVALSAWTWIAVALDSRRSSVLVFATAVLGTPWLFYGLEFWEHAPALGAAALGTAFVVAGQSRGRSFVSQGRKAALCFGVAILLRPEAACYVAAALLMAWPMGVLRPKHLMGIALATVGVVAPVVVYTQLHFGVAATPHLTGLASGFASGWFTAREALIRTWFVWPSTANAWLVAPACLLVLWPVIPEERRPRLLWVGLFLTWALTVLGVLLFAPNDGGAQWGPRYLLLAYGPLIPLMADRLQALWRRGTFGVVAVVCVLLGSAWMQRTAYSELRGAKDTYARVLSFVRATTPANGYVLTDLWWLDQVAASADDRRFLFADSLGTFQGAIGHLARARADGVTLVSGDESPLQRTDGAPFHSCYREVERQRLPDRGLLAVRFTRSCQ